MDSRTTSILSYISLVGWLIAYFVGDKNDEFAKYHLNQGLTLGIAQIVVSTVFGVLIAIPVIGTIFGLLAGLVNLGFFVLCIMGVLNAANNETKPLPVIGNVQLLK